MLRIFTTIAGAIAACAMPMTALAQDEGEAKLILFGDFQIKPLGPADRVEVTEVDGQQELIVSRTTVLIDGLEFAEGVIEFDMAFEDKFGFGGLVWHSDASTANSEYFYVRQHKSGLPDAGQYTPVRDGLTSWQIYTDTNGIAPFAHTHEGWNRIKFVIADDKADIYYNGSPKPVLHVPDLATDRGTGALALRTTGANGKIRFANLSIRPLADGEGIVGASHPAARTAPDGTITRWRISNHFPEAEVSGALALPGELAALETRAVLDTESFGIVDLSRGGLEEQPNDTALVSTRIIAEEAKRVRLQFGYSDRVRLFLNGKLIFDGSAGWRTRDRFFLGTIGFHDAAVLDLQEGENTLVAAVSETFGGWGFAGAIADREGLRVIP